MLVDESYRGANLVFLVGCPRSGTTWLQRLLAAHPRIRTGQESHLFHFYVGPQLRIWDRLLDPAATGRGGVGIGGYMDEEEFVAVVRRYMNSLLTPMLRPLATGELFLDKSPSHALYLPEICRLLPEARFIHIVRDPRDVVASLLAAGMGWGAGWAPRDARRAARSWVQHVQAVREGAGALRGGALVEVLYEELHDDPVPALRRVADFLDLPWPEAEIRRALDANTAVAVRSGGGTAIPIGGALSNPRGIVREPEGFVRSGQPGAWKRDLNRYQKLIVSAVAGPLMEEVGYDHRPPPGSVTLRRLIRALRPGWIPPGRPTPGSPPP